MSVSEPARKRRKTSTTPSANPSRPTISTSASFSDNSDSSYLSSTCTKVPATDDPTSPTHPSTNLETNHHGSHPLARQPIQQRNPYRTRSIYPTVAGRVTPHGHVTLPSDPGATQTFAHPHARTRDTQTHTSLSLAPSEVLLSAPDAPERHDEPALDVYGAHRWLGQWRKGDVYRDGVAEERVRGWRGNKGQVPGWSIKGDAVGQVEEDDGLQGADRGNEEGTGRTAADDEGDASEGAVKAKGFLKSVVDENEEKKLPDSDLLKAVHRYCSYFYDAMSRNRDETGSGTGKGEEDEPAAALAKKNNIAASADWYSLDETALLAFGILLEETCRSLVSDTTSIPLLSRRETTRNKASDRTKHRHGARSPNHNDEKLDRSNRTTRILAQYDGSNRTTQKPATKNQQKKSTRSIPERGEGWRALTTSLTHADPDPAEIYPNYLYAIEKRARLPFERGQVPRGVVRRDWARVRGAVSRRSAKETMKNAGGERGIDQGDKGATRAEDADDGDEEKEDQDMADDMDADMEGSLDENIDSDMNNTKNLNPYSDPELGFDRTGIAGSEDQDVEEEEGSEDGVQEGSEERSSEVNTSEKDSEQSSEEDTSGQVSQRVEVDIEEDM
ncbi:MAG: hypothetical protein M1831_003872 [Alyxoria varia]|nr:MAG: hypothetical protein M1831_003872 [Alyxoria varia]